jgi:predicted lipoprotein with Yx(FWY)xxD motif
MEISDMRNRWLAASGAAAAAALIAACGSSAAGSGSGSGGSSAPAASSGGQSGSTTAKTSSTGIKTAKASVGTILVTSKGFTIYLFAIDKPNKSNCAGTCATFWPPLKGKPTAAAGASLPGKFGTITRSDGSSQATYDGHPLYLYKGDTAPGQVHGNGINIEGGLWYAITPAGTKPSGSGGAPAPSSSSSGGGGYGY